MSTFRLERDLQTLLRHNLPQLKRGLKIHDGDREKVLEDGRRIDIEAIDAKGRRLVIELKAGKAGLKAVAQIRGYMRDEQIGRGILVAKSFTPDAITAAKSVPKIELREYSFEFTFIRRK
jgi:RecB family endonuclease NucS